MPELIHMPAPAYPTERRAFIVAILLRSYDLRKAQTDVCNERTMRNVAVATARQRFVGISSHTLHAWLDAALKARSQQPVQI